MIRIDLTTSTVTVEGDGDLDHLISVRTLQTEGSSSIVSHYLDEQPLDSMPQGRTEPLPETARARQGRNVMSEYDIDSPGIYSLTSGRREMNQNRTFYVRVEFLNNEEMQVTVLPGSFAPVLWVVEEDLHNYARGERFGFTVRVTSHGLAVADGEITRIESDQTGVKYERTTAWERLLEDDDPDSV